ncbi:uncharacterized protein F4822DRAFT_86326 [Hypoxylon trugodes]|uniref:uncharacterized protein n=1 Tax=Hypoxylon trugodes TaxID=326681 RepID=UPI002190C96D|nr:uncharacterized protein F4822DRAFT_86326 [Hypoxylon trugodes]KAI1382915.1 hypothetical protein F4822DRAFT_86326 [Hypoxylon trugodes]
MAPSIVTDDYYAVLGVTKTANADALKAAYRKLARIRHPDKNPGKPTATAEFQLLEAAYSTLCDPIRRRAYDLRFPTTFTNNGPTTPAYSYTYASTANSDSFRQKIHEKELRRDRLRREKIQKEEEVSEVRRNLARVEGEIWRLDDDEKRDAAEHAAEKSSWWRLFSSVIGGSQMQYEERSNERDRRRLNRIVTKRVKEKELKQHQEGVARLEFVIYTTQIEINGLTQEINKWKGEQEEACRKEAQRQREQEEALRREAQKQEEARRREAQRKREEEEARRRQAQWQKEHDEIRKKQAQRQQQEENARRERTRREKEEAEAARKAFEREEMRRRDQEEESAREFERVLERIRRATAQKAEERRRTEEIRRTEEHQRAQKERSEAKSCGHMEWWKKVNGSHICSHCSIKTTQFALQCPECKIFACASCRKLLQANGRRGRRSRRN